MHEITPGDTPNAKPLTNLHALITGCSRGIGAAIAKAFSYAGANLILTELPKRIESLKELSNNLKEQYGVNILPLELDLRDIGQIQTTVEESEKYFGTIDILVNNAGINILGPAVKLTSEQWDMVLDINLKGTFFLTQAVGKLVIKNKTSGSIISIASQHGVVGNEQRAAYCASKAGLINLSRALAIEWAKHGIRVNCVSPTFVLTKENEDILNSSSFQRANMTHIPLRKYAVPEDVAQAALFLASPSSGMITGHNLMVDGGWTAV